MRVGASSASPSVVGDLESNGWRRSAFATSRIRRISEKPFECGPLDAMPISRSPAAMSPVDDVALFDDADGESREVILAGGKHSRMLRRFAADQCATREFAAVRDALDHVGGDVDIESLADEVIEEEQRLRALDEDVVDAHRDEVDADRVVAAEPLRELELRADAIGSGDQHRFAEPLADLDQPAEAADAGEHFRAHRSLGEWLDPFDERIAGVDVDAGVAIRKGHGRRTGRHNGVKCGVFKPAILL